MIGTSDIKESPQVRLLSGAFARDVRAGLAKRPKTIPCTYLYDQYGSRLFQRITELEEYYLTRCEREILQMHAGRIAALLGGESLRVVEIGAGDGRKTEVLLRSLLQAGLTFEYVPIDICRQAVVDLTTHLRRSFAGHGVHVKGVVAEYFEALSLLAEEDVQRSLVLFLGSSIGNLNHWQAGRFLRGLRSSLQSGDYALVGFDLKKDPAMLQRAYDDAAGITRQFNFNLLARINRELRGQFDCREFTHHAVYNAHEGCMESWLISRQEQSVWIETLREAFPFQAWEGILVERSYKYDVAQVQSLARASGFRVCEQFFDERRYFVDALLEAESPTSRDRDPQSNGRP